VTGPRTIGRGAMAIETQAELEAMLKLLRAARYSGVLTVTHKDTTTTYKSDEEMRAAENDLLNRIAGFAEVAPRTTVASYCSD
jgi:hypothetical protein